MPDAQRGLGGKARVFITGSADGSGHAAAETLLSQGHDVVVHVRSRARLPTLRQPVD
ncbi:hypothetical protein [Acidovorax sp. MR-S7]|uniref:hypothetical protein n=1 Tax=Acidovorax sp. MR-S7 TaxID=1268622 RepID=UPI000366D92B|nr:hypothetical protein [Acidovorax sp. MR-S7]